MVEPYLRAIGFSPLMNIDKLILNGADEPLVRRFSPLMNIDKLIHLLLSFGKLLRFSPLMNIDKLIHHFFLYVER